MRPRFPLYAKILLWFFLNLAVVAAVLWLAFRVQFRPGFDWMLTGDAAARIESVSSLLAAELSERPREEWTPALARFSSAYKLQFYAFDRQGEQIAGPGVVLPPAVKARLEAPRRARRPPGGGGPRPLPPAVESPVQAPAPPAIHPAHPPPPAHVVPHANNPITVVRTTAPTRYWILARAGLRPRGDPETDLVNLVALSSSLSGGGLLFDPKPWLIAGAGVLLVSALLWLPLVRGITRSIRQITEATEQIALGRFDVRVDANRRDELGALGLAINQLALRLAGFVSGQKRFLGDIAHELCSPLARLQVTLGILEQRAPAAERPFVEGACEKAQQISALVNELLSFSKASLRGAPLQLRPVRLADAVQAAFRQEAQEQSSVLLNVPEGIWVRADRDLLVRAVSNLLRNAIRYAGDAGPICVSGQTDGPNVLLTVADSGPGIPADQLAGVFDPFYRVDPSRDRSTGGTGLGLAIVKTCIETCGGTIVCRHRHPQGLEVVIRLPSASGDQPEPEPAGGASNGPPAGLK